MDRHRMDAYRKIAVARAPADLEQIEAELTDVYGPLPDEVRLLLDIGELRIAASKHDIRTIVIQIPSPGIMIVSKGPTGDLIFSFKHDPGKKVKALFANTRGEVLKPDTKTVRLRLSTSYFEPRSLIMLLRKILGGNSG